MIGRSLTALALLALAAAPGAQAAGRSAQSTWHGSQIRMYDAEGAGHYGAGVVVAVIDGYVDRTHPDFEGRVLVGADCTSGTCVPGQKADQCTHGTHVAGTVASSSFGVAPRATVLPVRVLTFAGGEDCTGKPADVAAGIRWAVAHGADVLNLSLGPDVPGLGSSSAIPTAVSEAAAAGVVVVFSAGNSDLPVAQAYGDDALVVAATGPDGKLTDYTQYGTGVSVAAPGGQPDKNKQCSQATCVTSLYPGGQYAVAAGTSMAAPHVSGLAALLLGQKPSRGRADVVRRIRDTARPLAGAGDGLVDARAALAVRATSPAPRPTTASPTSTRRPPTSQTVRPPVRVAPSPAASSAGPTSSAAPSAVPGSAEPSASADPEAPPLAVDYGSEDREVPIPVAVVAVGLVTAVGSGVVSLSLRGRS